VQVDGELDGRPAGTRRSLYVVDVIGRDGSQAHFLDLQ
jgi:hypothetical protein